MFAKPAFVFVLLLTGVLLSNAQTDTINLPATEITSYKNQELTPSGMTIVRVISGEEIKNSPVQNLNDILDFAQGIDLRERGNMGVQSDLSIRGGTFEQSLVFLNGICMNNPQTGHHTLDLPIDPSNITKIEILKGPLARINGANAFAGAINIITEPRKANSINISASAGDFGWYAGSCSVSLNKGKTSHLISAGKMASGGYIKNTDFDYLKLYVKSNIPITNNFFANIEAGASDKAFGANSFYSAKYPDQFEQTRTLFINSNIKYFKKDISCTVSPYFRRYQDRFELFRDNSPSWYKTHNYHLTYVAGVKGKGTYISKYGKSTLGVDFKNERIYSNVLGSITGDTIDVPYEEKGFFTKYKERNILNIFADHTYTINNIFISGGLTGFYNDNSNLILCPGADIIWEITKQTKLNVSVASSVRYPTFTDLFYEGPLNRGNPYLKPEHAVTYEAGLYYDSKKHISIATSIFFRRGKNLIDWTRTADTLPWQSSNITEMNTYGAEVSILLNKEIFSKSLPFINSIRLEYSHLQSDKSSGEWISYYILDYLKDKAGLIIDHNVTKKINIIWVLNYQDRAGNYSDFVTNKERDYSPFFILSSRINFRYKFLKLYTDITNITNVKYVDFGNIYQPGRWFKVGITADIPL